MKPENLATNELISAKFPKKDYEANGSSFSHSKERTHTDKNNSLSVYNHSLYDWPKNKNMFQPPTIVMRRDLAFAVQAIFNNPSCPVIPCFGKRKKRERLIQRSYDTKYLNDTTLNAGGNLFCPLLIFCFLIFLVFFFFVLGAIFKSRVEMELNLFIVWIHTNK